MTLRKRLESVEERKAFRDYIETKRVFEERSADELEFFALHGYFPEGEVGGCRRDASTCSPGSGRLLRQNGWQVMNGAKAQRNKVSCRQRPVPRGVGREPPR
jgi:hypothetical protein